MKKEPYFTPATIHAKAREMLASVSGYRRRHGDIAFQPGRAALLVLDMQEYFLDPASHAFIPGAPAIIPNIQALIRAFHAHDRPIFFTRHVNTPEDAGMMAKWWRDLIRPEGQGSRIAAGLEPSKGVTLCKSQYDAFHQTALESDLRAGRAGQVVVTGVMTHLCCESTARSAFARGFEVFFAVDGTATYTEAFHRAALLNLAHGFAVPMLTEEFLAAGRGLEIHA
jgi:isochorismate hydrolase